MTSRAVILEKSHRFGARPRERDRHREAIWTPMSLFTPHKFGWHRDSPDPRDLVPTDELVCSLLDRLEPPRAGRVPRADWSEYLPPAYDQCDLAASAALACVTLAACFERRASGRMIDASAMFLYQMSRQLLQWEGDSGSTLRTTLKAMVRFGLPPEGFCRYDPGRLEVPPEPLLFAYRDDYATIRYVRLDRRGSTGSDTLAIVKAFLAAGFPCAFGFTVFSTLTCGPDIPMPTMGDLPRGGQAVVAVGYDDARRYRSCKGALHVRSSWGEGWGECGSGWLPYAYVEEQLAVDFWTLLRPEWLASSEFARPRLGRCHAIRKFDHN